MDYRKINSHIVLCLMVCVVGLVAAMIGRYAVLAKGADAGTANLTFLIVLGICAVVYLAILSTLSRVVIPWIMRKLPDRMKQDSNPVKEETNGLPVNCDESDDNPEEVLENIPEQSYAAKPDWKELHEKEIQSKLFLFREYTHFTMGPYVSEAELSRLDEYVELFARAAALPGEVAPIKPAKLKNSDLYHFGWNMQYYFNVGKREDVVPWLQKVFDGLDVLSPSTIKGKLHDYETRKYIIPNIDDIPKYMAEKKA